MAEQNQNKNTRAKKGKELLDQQEKQRILARADSVKRRPWKKVWYLLQRNPKTAAYPST